MTPDRIDDLLQRALETGAIPADATAEERAELGPMLAASSALKLNAARVSAEANAAVPTARARFQRHLEQQRRSTAPPARTAVARGGQSSGGFLGGFFGSRVFAMSWAVATIAVIAVLALVILQPFSSVETASALTVDDYVQLEGVVSANDGGTLTLQSPVVGDVEIAVNDQTALSDENGERALATLKAGDPVLVSGIVTAKRSIAASNVAVATNQSTPADGVDGSVTQLKKFREGLTGSVRVLSFSPDGSRARVLLVTARERLLVDVDARSMDRFLAANPRPLGAIVRILDAPDLPKGIFRIESAAPSAATPAPAANGPQFQNVRGVVVSRTANVLTVRTERGAVPVVVRRTTTIRFSDSGLTLQDVLTGEGVVGHEISVSGNQENANSRRITATLIVVLGKPQ
ncbi:MAG: DUF5666 domain-containing protein [Dehalococcoidia bacterium]